MAELPDGVPENAVDIGSGTYMVKVHRGDDWIGLMEFHEHNGRYSGGFVYFDVPANENKADVAKWQVASFEPLTLTPSIACHTCTHHGYITDGVWKDC